MSKVRISRLLVDKPNFTKKVKVDKDDPQKHLVYKLERLLTGPCVNAHTDLDELQRVADYACRKRNVKRVGVTIENMGKQRIFGWCKDYTIHLNADYHGDNLLTLVHELAHYIATQKNGDQIDAHGEEFVYEYAVLLDMFNIFPERQFFDLCDQYHVKYL